MGARPSITTVMQSLFLGALVGVAIGWAQSATAAGQGQASEYNLDGAPAASFVWFPPSPHVGEVVTLASTSTDLASAISAYAWDVTGSGEYVGGGPVTTTTFSTPADHVVRLRVSAADGLSSVATQTIQMSSLNPTVMHPFPIVRLVGVDYSYGTKISLLAVEAPAGAQSTVLCRGHGCPVPVARRSTPASARAATWIKFPRFNNRLLRPGVLLRVRVSKAGQIGAYARFVIRRGRVPSRIDSCLDPAGVKPIACPA
jgi:hypothetical protein